MVELVLAIATVVLAGATLYVALLTRRHVRAVEAIAEYYRKREISTVTGR